MKRYTIIDNLRGKEYNHSYFEWNLAWYTVFAFGFMLGWFIFFLKVVYKSLQEWSKVSIM